MLLMLLNKWWGFFLYNELVKTLEQVRSLVEERAQAELWLGVGARDAEDVIYSRRALE
jgi:hypothetical protein